MVARCFRLRRSDSTKNQGPTHFSLSMVSVRASSVRKSLLHYDYDKLKEALIKLIISWTRLIEFSLKNRGLMVAFYLGLALWDYWALLRTPIDAIPDLSDNQVPRLR